MTVAVSRRRQGGRGDHLCLDRQHRRQRRRLRRPRRRARCGDRARGQDRAGQAGPGGDPRRARDRAAGQLRPGAGDREADRRAPAGRAGQLDQPVPDRGPEDGGVRGLRRARARARRARDPGRQRRQHHGLVEGFLRVRTGPAGLYGFQAEGAAPIVLGRPVEHPETVASAIRIGNPARWEEAVEALEEAGGRSRRSATRDPRGAALAGRQRGRFLRAGLGRLRGRRAEAPPARPRCSCAC